MPTGYFRIMEFVILSFPHKISVFREDYQMNGDLFFTKGYDG